VEEMSLIDKISLQKLKNLNNIHVINIINEYVKLLKPGKIFVITDSNEDIEFVRKQAIEKHEEISLKMLGHTIHYDSYYDQARDIENTKILITPDTKMSKRLNTMDRESGLKEILKIMEGAMKNKDMIIRFSSLGPVNSVFSIGALQITDSWYVAHSEDILYRKGYNYFKNLKGSDDFFLLVHSAGELENNVTKNIEKRRVYIDLVGNKVLSVNNQYAGNSLGLKKLALRLAIFKSNNEDWLTEHMFIMGIHPVGKNRITYITGAYPSACGKTSTAMIPGQSIVGDDIAYIRNIKGECRGVNIEMGVFGIIKDVNQKDDPVIYNTLITQRELIFTNILINQGKPYWTGMGNELPKKGMNHSGNNWVGNIKDDQGNIIPPSHPNARYTVRISDLKNADSHRNDPEGVKIQGIFYGGRDSDTSPCVYESSDWNSGVFLGATIESETTSATLGKEGVRKSSPMANMDFLVVPLSKYLINHKIFGEKLKNNCPRIFATNYFLKDSNGKYTNEKIDKKIWILWAEARIHNEVEAIETPIGYIPKYKDLKNLFKIALGRDYSEQEYIDQFSIRAEKFLEKLIRMEKLFNQESDTPDFFWNVMHRQREELKKIIKIYNEKIISPFMF
jgi:phosphoenolpyruvate carboxykinase (GTP)